MKRDQLEKIVERAKCRIIGWDEASNDGHRLALATLIEAFNNSETALLCEPSLARKTHRPPDIVLIDAEIGVHVFEIKAIPLDQIEGLEAGGQFRIRYPNGIRSRNPIAQVRNAMFDIKDATVRGDESRNWRKRLPPQTFPELKRSTSPSTRRRRTNGSARRDG